jgi:hypothetical protein
MIGKLFDTGFRDFDLLEHELLLECKVRIRQHIQELKEKQEEITNRHNHMMKIDTAPRFLNTFDIDALLTPMGVDFECLIQEQGISQFQPFALIEYKIYDETGKKGVLSYGQKSALIELAKKSDLPAYAIWSHNNNDGSYTWFRLCLHHSNEQNIGKSGIMSDRLYYNWKMRMRKLNEYIDNNHLKALSDTVVRNADKIMEDILNNASK